MQNHLLQILALFAMETPVSLDAEDIRNEKVKVLRSMRPSQLEDVVVGQYKSHTRGGVSYPAYTDDDTVPKDSLTPTFAAAALFIDNARWDGVPFVMKAGKALHTRSAEIRVQFRHVPGNLYNKNFGTDLDNATNELVIRVQPDEAIYLKINNKVPGLSMRLDQSTLNLHYADRYSQLFHHAYRCCNCVAASMSIKVYFEGDDGHASVALMPSRGQLWVQKLSDGLLMLYLEKELDIYMKKLFNFEEWEKVGILAHRSGGEYNKSHLIYFTKNFINMCATGLYKSDIIKITS